MSPDIKQNLARIGKRNQNLALELSRLPELSIFKTKGSRMALENLLLIYDFSPDRFNTLFDAMDAEGLKASRKYCTPLQGLFWMIQDGKLARVGAFLGLRVTCNVGIGCRPELEGMAQDLVPAYNLSRILDEAWSGEAESKLSMNIGDIIDKIQTRSGAEEYAFLKGRRSTQQLVGYVMDDYIKQKEMFDAQDWETIQSALDESRWKNFFTVADRLNSPEVINYYINRYFFFRKTPSSGVYFTFLDKKAQCTDAAYFTVFMLDRAGYKTFIRSVKWDDNPWDGLHTGAGIIMNNGSYLLVSNYTGINAISGPFKQVSAMDRKITGNRVIIHSQWGAYYPPRYY